MVDVSVERAHEGEPSGPVVKESVGRSSESALVGRAGLKVNSGGMTYRNTSPNKRKTLLMLDDLQSRARLSLPRPGHDNRKVYQADGTRREEQVAVVGVLVLERGVGASCGELVHVVKTLDRQDLVDPGVTELAGVSVFQVDHVVVVEGW